MTDPITTPAQMREAAALAVANIEIGYHDGIGGDWHPYNGLHIISAACAAIRALPVADPLCTWPSCGHTAKGQCRTYTSGQLIAPNDASITATNIPVAEPEPLAVQVRAEALDALLADDEMCLRLAEGYDREDAAQRGEPNPHSDEEGYAEWAADRIACAKEGLRAIRALIEREPT